MTTADGKARRRSHGLPFAATLSASLTLAHGATAACEDFFKYEPNARLSVAAISQLVDYKSSSVVTARERDLMFAGFDREARPRRGEWSAYALIYAAGGLGERSAGGVLWARSNLDLYTGGYDLKFAKERGGIAMTLSSIPILAMCKRPMILRLDDQDRLFLNGVKVGEIDMEPDE